MPFHLSGQRHILMRTPKVLYPRDLRQDRDRKLVLKATGAAQSLFELALQSIIPPVPPCSFEECERSEDFRVFDMVFEDSDTIFTTDDEHELQVAHRYLNKCELSNILLYTSLRKVLRPFGFEVNWFIIRPRQKISIQLRSSPLLPVMHSVLCIRKQRQAYILDITGPQFGHSVQHRLFGWKWYKEHRTICPNTIERSDVLQRKNYCRAKVSFMDDVMRGVAEDGAFLHAALVIEEELGSGIRWAGTDKERDEDIKGMLKRAEEKLKRCVDY